MTKDEKRLNKLLQDLYDPDEDFSGVASDLLEYGDLKFIVHAHWKECWDYNCMSYSYCCSNCGKDALTKEETMYDQVLTKFCPYCGAQMDEVME